MVKIDIDHEDARLSAGSDTDVRARLTAPPVADLIDISSVDNFGSEPRFEVVYELYQFEKGDYLRLKLVVSEEELEVPSVASVWRRLERTSTGTW